jgi:hypothetical protein
VAAGGNAAALHALRALRQQLRGTAAEVDRAPNADRRVRGGGAEIPGVADGATTRRDNPENRAMCALSRRLHLDNALRYKVKMWGVRLAIDSEAETAERADMPRRTPEGGASLPPPHVGYCMMTMVLRNGLAHLMHGRHACADHALRVCKHHCVPVAVAARAVEFAQAWHDWAHVHCAEELVGALREGAVASVSSRYLAFAEPFAEAFVRGRCTPRGARMRGVLALVGFEADAARAIAAGVGGQLLTTSPPAWSPTLAAMGAVIPLGPGGVRCSLPRRMHARAGRGSCMQAMHAGACARRGGILGGGGA